MALESQLYLQVTAGASGLRAGLNGVAVFHDAGGDGRGFTTKLPVDEWILPSGNVATIDVLPQQGQDLAQAAVVYEEEDKDPVAELAWRATGGTIPAPFRVTLPFEAEGVRVKTKLWGEAVKLDAATFDDAARATAIGTALALYGAMALKDAAKVAELLEYRALDAALAYGCGPEDIVEGYLRAFQRPKFALEPVKHDEIRTTLVGGGRAVLVSRGDDAWLKCVDEPYFSPLSFPVCVALVDGKWVVAR